MDIDIQNHEADLEAEVEHRLEIAGEAHKAARDRQQFAIEASKSSQRISNLTDTEAGNNEQINEVATANGQQTATVLKTTSDLPQLKN